MKTTSLYLLVGLFAAPAFAAPFLVCDPYTNDANKPTEFLIITSGKGTVTVPATTTANGIILHQDIGNQAPGNYTVTVKAKNAGGESAASSPFSYTVAEPIKIPAAPIGIGLSAN